MANKNTFRRYSRTTVRDKRSLIRSLNSFTKQYKYASIEKVHLNKEQQIEFGRLMGLSFSQESYKTLGIDSESGLIYSEEIANNDLTNSNLIFEEIDNLISINTKYKYKEVLKNILTQYSDKNISTMFDEINEKDVIEAIQNNFICSIIYAKKVYNQLKNRIRYKYVGLYSVNNAVTKKINTLTPKFLTSLDILKSEIEYLTKREYLFYDDVLQTLRIRMNINNEWDRCFSEKNITEKIEKYFEISIYEEGFDDDIYFEAVEFLKYRYYQYISENSKYPLEHPYPLKLTSKYAIKNFKDQKNVIDYIICFNEKNDLYKKDTKYDYIESEYEHPVDETDYDDTSLSYAARTSASTQTTQWSKFYDTLVTGILSKTNNEYYKLYTIANMLLDLHNELSNENVYLDDGSINEYSSFLQERRQKIGKECEGLKSEDKQNIIKKFIALEKSEWKLIDETLKHYSFIPRLQFFDYEKLEF